MWVWPSFAIVDAWMCFVAYPGAPFTIFLGIRVVVELLMVGVYRASRQPERSITALALGQNVAFSAAAVGIALMAVWLGGVRSPYMHGISLVALVRAAVLPDRWRRALPNFAAIGMAFPAVMAAVAIASPTARADWLASDALVTFVSNYIFVLSSAVIGMVTSHLVWQAQQQVYRARRVGRYRLLAPIGKGGMGEVWLAWDGALQRNVALKLLRVDESAGPEMVVRFEREALAASRLQSPHIIQIFDYGASDDGLYYIAMEYLVGRDLQSLVEEEGPIPPERAIRFLMQVCIALGVAHQSGVIHRDIKPQNLFLTSTDGDPDFIKLLDFGVVRLREAQAQGRLTWTGMLVGTPVYLAPELWSGVAADERSDIYAVGVTAYYLLSGRLPFDTALVSPVADRAAAIIFGLESPPALRNLELLVRRCLANEPDARVQSSAELCNELGRILELLHGAAAAPAESATDRSAVS